ncbi:MAG: selenocysteine-specific translation elongation factor [Gemmatimonadota bacterium]
MHRLILGTAGHIDHGKTALVQALTGIDTDRLPEEKARGITIDLGFAELREGEALQLGVVDVPGHEDFVRTMVAGASGMDVVLLVVGADEGVMPQTREHFDIVRLLDVPAMVVALTKADLVDDEWLSLVDDDVRDLLRGTPYADSPRVVTSARTGSGVDELRRTLLTSARGTRSRQAEDLARLPVDRVFTVQGTGTVVTGTLGSGTLSVGDRVRLLPTGVDARIRSLQVHGRNVDVASAGERTAAALAATGKDDLERGTVLVSSRAWTPTWMLTARVEMLEATSWALERGQRVRVHVGTQEVMARCVLFDTEQLVAGQSGWAQLRLEEPSVARAGDRLVIRSYSPVQTMAGAVVVEPLPPKRKRLEPNVQHALQGILDSDVTARAVAATALADWHGVSLEALPIVARCTPEQRGPIVRSLVDDGALLARDTVVSAEIARKAERIVETTLDHQHESHPLRAAVPLDRIRAAFPEWVTGHLADAAIERLAQAGALEVLPGGARRPDFEARPNPDQAEACRKLLATYTDAGLSPPFTSDLPPALGDREDLSELLRYLEGQGRLTRLDADLLIDASVLAGAATEVTSKLGGRTGLGPTDFREVLPVSRRHLMPLLSHLDGLGVTRRRESVRDVPSGPG